MFGFPAELGGFLILHFPQRSATSCSDSINGFGDYGFMLTAVDGQIDGGGGVDKFRIKIWDKATESVIYDNQTGASERRAIDGHRWWQHCHTQGVAGCVKREHCTVRNGGMAFRPLLYWLV